MYARVHLLLRLLGWLAGRRLFETADNYEYIVYCGIIHNYPVMDDMEVPSAVYHCCARLIISLSFRSCFFSRSLHSGTRVFLISFFKWEKKITNSRNSFFFFHLPFNRPTQAKGVCQREIIALTPNRQCGSYSKRFKLHSNLSHADRSRCHTRARRKF